jgi:undecaprenyl-diphosphatase
LAIRPFDESARGVSNDANMSADIWRAAVLGIVQGVTEFLPISSTGHLILVPALLGWTDTSLNTLEFTVALHVGTLASLLAVFWRQWIDLAAAALRSLRDRTIDDNHARLAWLLVLATIPGVAAGILFEEQVETMLRSPVVVGGAMVVVATVLGLVDWLGSRTRDEYTLGPGGAFAVGVGQALALIPGVSRSGSTIAVGLSLGLTRAAAARFSFLLSTPIIAGAVAKQSVDVALRGVEASEMATLAVGIAAAAISGYACIRFLLAYLRTRSLLPFVIYRVVVGGAVLLLALSGRI